MLSNNVWNKSYNHITFDKFRKGNKAPKGYKFVVNNMNYSNTTFPCIYLVQKQQKGLKCIAPWNGGSGGGIKKKNLNLNSTENITENLPAGSSVTIIVKDNEGKTDSKQTITNTTYSSNIQGPPITLNYQLNQSTVFKNNHTLLSYSYNVNNNIITKTIDDNYTCAFDPSYKSAYVKLSYTNKQQEGITISRTINDPYIISIETLDMPVVGKPRRYLNYFIQGLDLKSISEIVNNSYCSPVCTRNEPGPITATWFSSKSQQVTVSLQAQSYPFPKPLSINFVIQDDAYIRNENRLQSIMNYPVYNTIVKQVFPGSPNLPYFDISYFIIIDKQKYPVSITTVDDTGAAPESINIISKDCVNINLLTDSIAGKTSLYMYHYSNFIRFTVNNSDSTPTTYQCFVINPEQDIYDDIEFIINESSQDNYKLDSIKYNTAIMKYTRITYG